MKKVTFIPLLSILCFSSALAAQDSTDVLLLQTIPAQSSVLIKQFEGTQDLSVLTSGGSKPISVYASCPTGYKLKLSINVDKLEHPADWGYLYVLSSFKANVNHSIEYSDHVDFYVDINARYMQFKDYGDGTPPTPHAGMVSGNVNGSYMAYCGRVT